MAVLCKVTKKLYVGFSVILSCVSCILKPQMKLFFQLPVQQRTGNMYLNHHLKTNLSQNSNPGLLNAKLYSGKVSG